jgi:hypothetical protein
MASYADLVDQDPNAGQMTPANGGPADYGAMAAADQGPLIGPPSPSSMIVPSYSSPPPASPINNGNLQLGGGLSLPGPGPPPTQAPMAPLAGNRGGTVMLSPTSPLASSIAGLGDVGPAPVAKGAPPGAAPAIHFDNPLAAGAAKNAAATKDPALAPWAPTGGGGGGANPLLKDLAAEKDIQSRGADAADQERMGLLGQQQHYAETQASDAAEARAKADRDLADQQEQLADLHRQQEVSSNYHIDPNRYMRKQNFLQTGLMGISAALNAVSKAFLHQGGPNEILQQMDKNIDRDIDAQKSDYEALKAKGQDAQNLYAMNLKATGNHDQAIALAKAQGLEAQKTYMQAQASRVDNANLRTNVQLAGNAIDQKIDTYKMQAAAAGAAASAAQRAKIQARAEKLVDEHAGITPAQAHQAAVYEATGVNPDPRTPLPSFMAADGFNQKGEKLKSGAADKAAAKVGAVDDALQDLNRSSGEVLGTDASRLSSHSTASAQEDVREGKMVNAAILAGISPRLAVQYAAKFKPAVGDTDEAKKIKMGGFADALRLASKAPDRATGGESETEGPP